MRNQLSYLNGAMRKLCERNGEDWGRLKRLVPPPPPRQGANVSVAAKGEPAASSDASRLQSLNFMEHVEAKAGA